MALELGWAKWDLTFARGLGDAPRHVRIPARDLSRLWLEIAKAKRKLGLPADAPVVSCYEAGRDGFWLHRCLCHNGVTNCVVDASSIEVNRRCRRAKSDRLDGVSLVRLLIRFGLGERSVWKTVNVPTVAVEDDRQPQRERIELSNERTRHVNRVKALLASIGIEECVDDELAARLPQLRQWDDTPMGANLRARIARELERLQLLERQLRELETAERRLARDDQATGVEKVRLLLMAKGVGARSAWLLVREFFGWRQLRNGKQVGALAGLTPTPYSSGQSQREQGISKSGNKRIRWIMVELAWKWLYFQPQSKLARWYQARFGSGSRRQRKIGIVALARKLLIALWRLADQGEIPDGAVLVDWKAKLACRRSAPLPA
jgi:transposase